MYRKCQHSRLLLLVLQQVSKKRQRSIIGGGNLQQIFQNALQRKREARRGMVLPFLFLRPSCWMWTTWINIQSGTDLCQSCKPACLILLINYFINFISTVKLADLVPQHDMASRISALACWHLLFSELPRTQVVCLTTICQNSNFWSYHIVSPTVRLSVAMLCYNNYLFTHFRQVDSIHWWSTAPAYGQLDYHGRERHYDLLSTIAKLYRITGFTVDRPTYYQITIRKSKGVSLSEYPAPRF